MTGANVPFPPRAQSKHEVRSWRSRFSRLVVLPGARYIRIDEIAGAPLLLATVLALLWANSPWRDSYHAVWGAELAISLDGRALARDIKDWINDALLPLFFFVIGMEIKRELLRGQLSNWKDAALPVFAALGGMLAPALAYLLLNAGGPAVHGWGIPVATDIAFALAVLALGGERVPPALRILVLAFATADDIGGVLVIAAAYTAQVQWAALAAGLALFGLTFLMTRMQIISTPFYLLFGIATWFCIEQSGMHATIAGVLLGALVPVHPRVDPPLFEREAPAALDQYLQARGAQRQARQDAALGKLEELSVATEEPVERLSHLLNPWISYGVLPLFALANAGVALSPAALGAAAADPAAWGIAAGLLIGKPLGLVGCSWLAVRFGLAQLPQRVGWKLMGAIGLLSGIGFTISLFIAQLAFRDAATLDHAKIGIFASSMLAGAGGYLMLRFALREE